MGSSLQSAPVDAGTLTCLRNAWKARAHQLRWQTSVVNSTPPLGLLLDVDGPLASPLTRTIAIPSIIEDLVSLANLGVPVVFNTGRTDLFLR